MKKQLLLFLIALSLLTAQAQRDPKEISFTMCWEPQAQFAGYYIAYEKGFFKDAGLNVKIKHQSSSSMETAAEMLKNGYTDIIVNMPLQALTEYNFGTKIVNILQTSQNCGLMLVSHNEVKNLDSFDDMKVGKWKYAALNNLIFIEDEKRDIKWINILGGINVFLTKAIDAVTCYSYNEFIQLKLSRGDWPSNKYVNLSDVGYNIPEDGVYTTEEYYNKHKDEIKRFKEACIKGWEYARQHKSETLEIVMKYTSASNVATNTVHQSLMLDEILRLQEDQHTHKATYAPITEEVFNRIKDEMTKKGLLHNDVNYKDFIK